MHMHVLKALASLSLFAAVCVAQAQDVPPTGTPPAPDASCTVTAMNRTAPLQSDYSFTIYNIPGAGAFFPAQGGVQTPSPPFRVRAVCSDGTVGETELAFPVFGDAAVYTGPLFWRPVTPIPLAVAVVPDNPRLGSNGTTQLHTTGTLADASTTDLTPRTRGTLYTSSNPLIAQVSENGLVTVAATVASGSSARVLVTGQNEGVAGTALIEIGPRGRITGRVMRADGVSPVPGAQVSILRDQPRDTLGTVAADAGGNFALEDVAAGNFTLSVIDPATGDMGRGHTSIQSAGDVATADIALNGQGVVTVTVVNGADAPVANALVTFTSLSGFRDLRTIATGSDGRAIFERALAGQFTVSTRDDVSGLVGAALGNLTAGGNAQLTLRLQPIGSIAGAVYASDGVTAQAGVQVRLVSAVRGIVTQTISPANGSFQFDSLTLSDSPYILDAFYNGRLRARIPGLILTSAGQLLTQNIVFGPAGTVTGTVLRNDGEPAQNITISLQSQVGQRFTFAARTDAQGRYRIDAVPVGAFTLTATGDNGEVATGGGNVTADAQTVVVDLQLAANGIVGTVFQRDAQTPVGAGVQVVLQPGNVVATTNAQGQYGFTITQPNRYVIEASDGTGNRGRTELVLTTVTPGNPITANVTFLGRGVVQGIVRDPNGAVQANASVELTSSSVFGGQMSAVTNAQGAYRFDNVFVGDVSVYARNPSTGLAGVAQSRVVGDAVTVTADVTLAATGSVTGQVVRSDNATPAAGALVELYINGSKALSATANAAGAFEFAAVPIGDFRLDATETSTGDRGRVVSRITTVNEVRTASIRLLGVGPVTVHAVDGAGANISGATVTLESQSVFGGSQTVVTDAAGVALFPRVFNGDFAVSGTKGAGVDLLSGSASGTMVGGAAQNIELTMTSTPVGSVTGVVTRGLAADPQSGVTVRLQPVTGNGVARNTVTGVDGRYQFAQVEVGRSYRLTALINSRVRARVDFSLTEAGEILTRDLALLGVGSVSGVITNAQSQPQSGIQITLTNSDPTYGGTWTATTRGDGTYSFAEIPAGAFVIRARSNDSRLQAQGSGEVRFDGDAAQVSLVVVDSAVNLPRTLYDANGSPFNMSGDGSISSGLNGVFNGADANRRGLRLELVVNGTAVPFTNGDGSIGRLTQDGQLLEVDEFSSAAGLDVTRRIYVPKTGYFTRYLEVLENRTANPITVGLRVVTSYSQGSGGARIVDSSNSDNVLTIADGWFVMDDEFDDDAFASSLRQPPVVQVMDAPDGEHRVGSASTSAIGTATNAAWEWQSITVPAGTSVGFMHFTAQQRDRTAARATAERLVQLPPEALEGLTSEERAIIRNFRVPADGLSTLQPLPPVVGSVVSGVVYAGDGVTTLANSRVTYRNTSPYYGQTYQVNTTATGSYQLSSGGFGTSNAVALVRDAFTVQARHPVTSANTAQAIGIFVEGQTSAVQDLIFVGTGNLRGTVRRHNGALVTSGEAYITYRFPDGHTGTLSANISSSGEYHYTGIEPGDYIVSARQSHPQGGYIQGNTSAQAHVSPANTTLADITMPPTGEITGLVLEADGDPAVNASVCLDSCTRSTTTDTGGRYRLTDVTVGSHVVTANRSGLNDEATVNVVVDTAAVADMQLTGSGTVVVQVNYARGVPAANVRVVRTATGAQVTTNGVGQASFMVPAGTSHQFRATHPDDDYDTTLTVSGSAIVESNGGETTLALTLPPAGNIVGTVVRPDGSTLAANVSMTLRRQDGSGWQRSSSTNSSGAYVFRGLPPGSYTVSAADAATLRYADADAAVTTDGADVTVNLRLADNRIALPAQLRDANDFAFDIERAGYNSGGGHTYVNVYSSTGGAQLEISGQAYAGDSSALLEAGRRQFAITQPTQIAGLNVTRKVFVPIGGYFARYLEILQNPGAAPLTVSVKVRNNYAYSTSVQSTSSGDTTLNATDVWGVFDDSTNSDPFLTGDAPSTAMVLGAAGAPLSATNFVRASSSRVEAEWTNVVVPAGGRVVLMHFQVQQVSRAGAIASAERLVQLPPEALQSLTPEEIGGIANFVMPAGGVSTVSALPNLLGSVNGVVYEGDGVTVVPQTRVSVRSTHPLFGRTYAMTDQYWCEPQSNLNSLTATATGAFSLNGVLQANDSVALPVGSEVVIRTVSDCIYTPHHPTSGLPSPEYRAMLDGAALTQNVVFASGILTGTVIGAPDYSVSGAYVQANLPNRSVSVSTDSSAQYRIAGVPAGTHTLNVSLYHNQGSELRGSRDVAATVGQTTVADINIEPTGSVSGAVLTANGEAAGGRSVALRMTGSSRSFNRYTTSDGLGRFAFSAVPVGTYTLSVTESQTGAVTSLPVTVTQNTATTQNVVLIGNGSVELTVMFARGVPAANSEISLRSSAAGTSFRNVGRTDAFGRLNVLTPVGTYTLRARNPNLSSVLREVNGTVAANNETQSVTATLPALANVRLTVLDADNGGVALQGASVRLTHSACSDCSVGTTDGTGRVLASNVRDGNYILRVTTSDGRATSVGGVIDAQVDGQTVEKTASLSINDYSYGTLSFGNERHLYTFPAVVGDNIRIFVNGYGLNGAVSAYAVYAQLIDPNGSTRAEGYGYDSRNNYYQYNTWNDLTNSTASIAGRYTVALSSYYSGQQYLGGYRVQAIVNGEIVDLAPYQNAGSVSGVVYRSDGTTPAAGHLVEINSAQPTLRVRARTAADGSYTFGNVPVGDYQVRLFAEDGNRVLVTQSGTLEAAGESDALNLTLPVRTRLDVNITVADGLSVPTQMNFTVVDVTGSSTQGPVTFENGSRTSSTRSVDVYGQTITVRATHPEGAVSTARTVTGVEGGVVAVDLQLAGARVSGRVLTADGEPVASRYVTVRRTSDWSYITAMYASSLGEFVFGVVPAGEELSLSSEDPDTGVVEYVRFTANPGDDLVRDIQFRGLGTVTGRITRANGVPLRDTSVYVRYQYDERYEWSYNELYGYTNDNGEYQFTDAPVGRELTVIAYMDTSFGRLRQEGSTTIATRGSTETVDLAFTENFSTFTARVLGVDGQAVPGSCEFRIEMDGAYSGEGGEWGYGYASGPCGGAEFTNAPAGEATLTAFHYESYVEFGPQRIAIAPNSHGEADIRVSVVKGVVRFADGTPAPYPWISLDSDSEYYYPMRTTDENGAYALFDVPAGPFTLEAQDDESGLWAEVQGELTDPLTPLIVDVTLPASGTVAGVFLDASGEPVVDAEIYVRGSGLSVDRQTYTDENGAYRIERVALGTVTVWGRSAETNLISIGEGELTANGATLQMNLTPPITGTLTGRVVAADGTTPVADALVTATTVTSYGPFEVLHFETTTQADGSFALNGLPVGDFRVIAELDLVVGRATATVDADGTTLDLTLGDGVMLPYVLNGADGSRYDVTCAAQLADGGYGSATDAYDYAYYFRLDREVGFPCVDIADTKQSGRELVLGPHEISNLMVSRQVYVPQAGGYARYLETLSNPTANDITVEVQVDGSLGSYPNTQYVGGVADQFFITSDVGSDPTLGHVYSGPNPPVQGVGQFTSSGYAFYRWNVTIPAGQQVALLHFAIQRGDGDTAGAVAQAQALANGTQPDMFDGLTSTQRASIRNFTVSQ